MIETKTLISFCQKNKFKTLIFDLDNTLVDRDAAFKALILRFLKYKLVRKNQPISSEEIDGIMEKDNHGFLNRISFSRWFVNTYKPVGYNVKEFYDWQIDHIAAHVKPISVELTNNLRNLSEKYQLILLSNGGLKNQFAKIKNAKLEEFFPVSHRFISGETGFIKPDIKAFTQILDQFNLEPKDTLMIGDDPINDIEGAKNAGLATFFMKPVVKNLYFPF